MRSRSRNPIGGALQAATLLIVAAGLLSCEDRQSSRLIVAVPSLSISRLPYIIAQEEGLYAKYGLQVELWTASQQSDNEVVVHADWLTRVWRALGVSPKKPDVETNGASPMMLRAIEKGTTHHQVAIASTDCVVRAHIIGRKGITQLSELKGKRIGVGSREATSGFHALLLAQRMGWDPVRDIVLIADGEDVGRLIDGSLDAIVGYEREYATAKRDGLPILADTREWNETLAGNSALVDADWLKDPSHREAARRFVKATAEAIALFHRHPEVAFGILDKWYGIKDTEIARTLYARGSWIPRKPYPCYEGFNRTMMLYDKEAWGRHTPQEFYDDSLVREIDSTGFIDGLYR